MSTDATPHRKPLTRSRLGMHYYPDSLHYRESDLLTWLPELKGLGAAWLTLQAPPDRAIPEPFIKGLIKAKIEPILHFLLPLTHDFDYSALNLLFDVYARWGIRYVILFDRPNQQEAWPASAWAQSDLVERFLDIFLPVANQALQAGLAPVFPPLEPGGDYWDTSFLQAALQGIQRRQSRHSTGEVNLLDALHLSAYAWADGHPLDWGAGGPACWPGVRPYLTPEGQQDQRGFHIFDWYLAHAQAALGAPCPILLLAAGQRLPTSPHNLVSEAEELEHAAANRTIAERLATGANLDAPAEPISPYVLACNFWLMAAEPGDPHAPQAWFQPDGYTLPVVDAIRQFTSNQGDKAQAQVQAASDAPAFALESFEGEGQAQAPDGAHIPERNLQIEEQEAPIQETPTGTPAVEERSEDATAVEQIAVESEPEPIPATETEPIEAIDEGEPGDLIEEEQPGQEVPASVTSPPEVPGSPGSLPIAHYLLLPLPDTGAAEWLLEAARPYMLKHHPTTGYSPEEAALARRVTVVGGEQVFPEDLLASLRSQGCAVERIAGDGTEIATHLETQ